ncbi:MAG: HyaD/HybD family hydrogenase maturation endopeptidase [Bryobacteraceae bacterium]
MTGSVENAAAPVLVMGLGNQLLSDDGVGLCLLSRLAESGGFGDDVEFVDGGTQGLALLPYLARRRSILMLDAASLGAPAGTVHVLHGNEVRRFRARRAPTPHESSAMELLETAELLGDGCDEVAVVGVEPAMVRTGIGLSPEVESNVAIAVQRARELLEEMVAHVPRSAR